MKHLYVLRHAKSSWKQRGLSDHDRPLARRGRRATAAIARHLYEQGIEPELVLCSTRRRARERLERIETELATPAVPVESELDGAIASALLDRLRSVPEAVGSVMLIGHNPGLQRLALELAQPAPAVRELEAKYPTAGLAILAFDRPSWGELDRPNRHPPCVFSADGGIGRRCGLRTGRNPPCRCCGNSNWRGPVWFPVNHLLMSALERFHRATWRRLHSSIPRLWPPAYPGGGGSGPRRAAGRH